MFNDARYNRQQVIPLLGEEGQERLARSSVAVVGAGGVKSPILIYLAAAGVGRLRIIDFDRVELSNLNRQILFTSDDIGKFKAYCAENRLKALNPEISIEVELCRADTDSFDNLFSGFDLIYEGGDGFENRCQFNRWALRESASYIHASAHYNYSVVTTVVPGKSHCLECIYEGNYTNRGEAVPVLGIAAGIAGTVAASEGINILSGQSPAYADKLWVHQGWSGETILFDLSLDKTCEHFDRRPR